MVAHGSRDGEPGAGISPAAAVIAIDGPSGTGKSTVARAVARRIGARYLDTGALYRIVTLHALDAGADPTDPAAVEATLFGLDFATPTGPDDQIQMLSGRDVTARIREADVTAAVSAVSAIPAVRAFLLGRQRTIAAAGPVVIEGRDIGTVIAPDAAVKVFLTADAGVRAERRLRQDADRAPSVRGGSAEIADVATDLDRRDSFDVSRTAAPLRAADDAVLIDSTRLTVSETVDAVLRLARERGLVAPLRTPPRRATAEHGAERHDATASESAAGTHAASPVSRPVTWWRLGGLHDPVPAGRRPRDVDRGRRIGIALSHLMYRMTVHGEENIPVVGPLVVVANHTTFTDGPILFGRLPRRISFLVKAEVLVGPLGWLLRTVGQYAIDRAAPQRDVLLAALAHLKSGGVIGIFPEGQRTDGSVTEVFHGAGWLAARAGATVVPVAVRGTARPAGRRLRRYRPRVVALVGQAFDIPQGAGRIAIAAATSTIQQRLKGVVADLDRALDRAPVRSAGDGMRFGRGRRRQ